MALATVPALGCHHTGSLNGDAGPDTDSDSDSDSDTDIDCTQGAYSGDLTVETQSDIATLAGYTSISGDLYINCPLCTDLSDLVCLASVGERLLIADNDTLTNLNGLSGITSVGLNLSISDNHALTSLYGLNGITSVGEGGGGLTISFNTILTNLTGLSALTSVGWSLSFYDNYALTNLDGLSALTSVGGALYIDFNVLLPDCEVCDLLDQLTSVPTGIDVHDNLDDSCTPVPANCP